MKLRGEVINDIFMMWGYISSIIMLGLLILMKIVVMRREREEAIKRSLERQAQEQKKPSNPDPLPPRQQKQLRGRVKVALIAEKNDEEMEVDDNGSNA